jgi:SAM-dependent methyltransferase
VNLAAKALARLREGGVPGLGKSVVRYALWRRYQWLDAEIDRKYGVETTGEYSDLAALGAEGEHVADAIGYLPVQIPVFRDLIRATGIDPRRHLFVDFGCGKGRALILAAEHGFRRVIGVEFAPPLYRLACRNAEKFGRLRPDAPPIEVHFGDAAAYPIPHDDAVLFFYHPFNERVMGKVVANIGTALRGSMGRPVVAYRNPVHCEALDRLQGLHATVRNRSFAIYKKADLPAARREGRLAKLAENPL